MTMGGEEVKNNSMKGINTIKKIYYQIHKRKKKSKNL
jgi:hypothetical protein